MRRDDEQADAVSRLLEHKRGTVLFPTGYGKTRTARLAYEAIGGSTLVVTSRTNLLPQWRKELGPEPHIVCINTGHKLKMSVKFLIVDEAHRSLSPKFRELYSNVEYEYLLLLTATKPHNPDYWEFMQQLAPVIKEKSVEEALVDDAISDFKIFNVEIGTDKSSSNKYNL